ncbi:nucleotide-binding domain containing protein [Mameliella sp.]|uniref:nucleotide-binding domain containing protein n=1 Tax=Mameliella sp. TaxID=1924940 RepID=UPI003B50898B
MTTVLGAIAGDFNGATEPAGLLARGITQLDMGREIAPGVPWCPAESLGPALKSGNFGAESCFTDALDMLDR